MSEPWKDWIPGVLSKKQIQDLCENNIKNVGGCGSRNGNNNPIDHSSVDLTLSDEGYEMTAGTIKPTREDSYRKAILENQDYAN